MLRRISGLCLFDVSAHRPPTNLLFDVGGDRVSCWS